MFGSIEQAYQHHRSRPSDIWEHLPVLNKLADGCDHVTEFGVRWGASTSAFMASRARLVSYDIVFYPEAQALFELAVREGKEARFINASTLEIDDIEPTDMLFIDTLHTRDQLAHELRTFAHRASRYIAMHDTTLFGEHGEDGGPGLWEAVEGFLRDNGEWKLMERYNNNNGLTILERTR